MKNKNAATVPLIDKSNETIFDEEFPSLIDEAYMRYTFFVMKDRALPDAEDGLKPSQRRVLVAMNDLGLSPSSATEKCAKVVGQTMGSYHPHGDMVIYPTLVGMVQDWSKRYPLINGQGNFGNIGGAPAAAQRYTECRLSRHGASLLADLSPEVVGYVPNYNDKLQEPVLLPSLLPNLLVNGGAGIAVGVATKLAPHNLREVAALICAYIKDPQITIDDALAIMPGPDFPTGGVLRGQKGVRDYYETGRGSLQIDGVYEIVESEKGGQRIIVTGLPYGSSPNKLSEQIEEMVKTDRIKGVSDLKDLSVRHKDAVKIKVVVDISKNGNANLVLNQLLKSTCLRVNFDVNATVLVGGKVLENASLMKLVEVFVGHRKDVLTKKFRAELSRSEARIHILDGLLSVAGSIDAAIRIIRAADSPEEAASSLVESGLVEDELQAKAVLGITLSKLTKLETGSLAAEKAKLEKRGIYLVSVLASEKKLLIVVASEQEELARVMGDDRRTQIGLDTSDINAEDLIPEEQVVISLTKDGYIKRIPVSAYKVQGRGGKGVIGVKSREQDDAGDIFIASTHDLLLFFTSAGLVYRKKGYEIPAATRTSKGTHLANLLALNTGETVTNTISLDTLARDGYLVMVTKGGLIKRSLIRDYNTRFTTKGLQAIKLQPDDQLAFVESTDGTRDVFLATANGKAIRYPEITVRATGRITEGVQAMKLLGDDKIAQLLTIDPSENPSILVVTSKGFGKKSDASAYRCFSGRSAQGISTIDKVKSDRNGLIVAAVTVSEGDTLMVLSTKGKLVQIPAESVRQTGRIAMGVKVVSLDDGDSVACITKVKNGMDMLDEE